MPGGGSSHTTRPLSTWRPPSTETSGGDDGGREAISQMKKDGRGKGKCYPTQKKGIRPFQAGRGSRSRTGAPESLQAWGAQGSDCDTYSPRSELPFSRVDARGGPLGGEQAARGGRRTLFKPFSLADRAGSGDESSRALRTQPAINPR